ncbi:MAG: hypothetical protein WD768_02135 [Phycisphaeraceae bacterium]
MLKFRFVLMLTLALTCITPAFAGIGDPTLRTDHPHYAGDGAFQTAADCVAFATRGLKADDHQERAIAVYQWLLTHQWHLHSPQEWLVPGVTPGAKNDDYEMVVYDATRGRFSYGYGLCGTVHAWNEAYWRALNMNARRRAFPGHTNSEILYNGSWHAFDTDMAGLVFRKDGIVAGYDDIIKDPSIVKPNERGLPCYPFAWPSDFNGMKKGWQEIAKAGAAKWYSMYHSGYEGMPGIVNLRRGEEFTRFYNRDAFGSPDKRRFWHVQKNGPFRDWAFFDQGEPKQDAGGKANARGNASYCNAEFVYTPDLKSDAWREGTINMQRGAQVQPDAIKHDKDNAPHLKSATGKPASIIFTHYSPYVICGDPADDTDPMTKPATDGLTIGGVANGKVKLAISTNMGQSWHELGEVTGDFRKDATDLAKGRYWWWVRLTFEGDAGLERLQFVTFCQMNQAMYPRLKTGGSEVVWRAGSRAVQPMVPDFGLSEAELAGYVKAESNNLQYAPRSAKQRLAYKTTNNKPGQIVLNVTAPENLLEVHAAARFQVRVPPPKGCDFHLALATPGGAFQKFADAPMPEDNEYSSGWVYGKQTITAATKSAQVRVNLYAGGYTTGLITAEAYGVYQTPQADRAVVTYNWYEGDRPKSHMEVIPAGTREKKFTVPTGKAITDEYVRIAVP